MSVRAESLVMNPEPTKPLLDPEEEAFHLGISRSTLDRWSRTPGFPVLRTGRVVKFPWKAVDEFIEQCARDGRQLYMRTDRDTKKRGRK